MNRSLIRKFYLVYIIYIIGSYMCNEKENPIWLSFFVYSNVKCSISFATQSSAASITLSMS